MAKIDNVTSEELRIAKACAMADVHGPDYRPEGQDEETAKGMLDKGWLEYADGQEDSYTMNWDFLASVSHLI